MCIKHEQYDRTGRIPIVTCVIRLEDLEKKNQNDALPRNSDRCFVSLGNASLPANGNSPNGKKLKRCQSNWDLSFLNKERTKVSDKL
jgi:hypothetical protein